MEQHDANLPTDHPVPLTGSLFTRVVPFLDLLEIRPVDAQRGRSRFRVALDDRHLRALGVAHGAIGATLLDAAMGYAAATTRPEDVVVTIQLDIHYVRPAWRGESLIATGEVAHAGKRTAYTRGEIHTADGTLIATGTATFVFRPHTVKSE